jgi:hypothetical protein
VTWLFLLLVPFPVHFLGGPQNDKPIEPASPPSRCTTFAHNFASLLRPRPTKHKDETPHIHAIFFFLRYVCAFSPLPVPHTRVSLRRTPTASSNATTPPGRFPNSVAPLRSPDRLQPRAIHQERHDTHRSPQRVEGKVDHCPLFCTTQRTVVTAGSTRDPGRRRSPSNDHLDS